MFEYEKKILLTEQEYEKLFALSNLSNPSFTQKNHYYDTDDFRMNSCGITCRIREKSDKFKATIKEHDIINRHVNVETSAIVNDALDDSVFRHLGVKYMGCLTTHRTILYHNGVFEIAIDKNTYLDKTDYELEIEYSPNNPEQADFAIYTIGRALQFFNGNLTVEEFSKRAVHTQSKSNRFFERLKSLQQ